MGIFAITIGNSKIQASVLPVMEACAIMNQISGSKLCGIFHRGQYPIRRGMPEPVILKEKD